jgi:GAF domain-containing protein
MAAATRRAEIEAFARQRTRVWSFDRLVDEHAALQRVAVVVAQAVQPAEIFASVSEEVGRLFDSDMAVVGRYDPDGPAFVVVSLAKAYEGLAVDHASSSTIRWPWRRSIEPDLDVAPLLP